MDIVIVSQYLRNIENLENNNSRFVYIAKLLSKSKEDNIEIITSDFSHARKRKFNKKGKLAGVKITTCHELGYFKNVCLKRLKSHEKLSQNIEKYLEKRNRPDCIYCAIPSLAVGKRVAQYCKKYNIRFIIDVQDLWPEAFKMVFKVPILSDMIFYPMKKQADYIYKCADEVVAVSETYVNRALKVNKKCSKGLSVFLGTDLEYFDKYAKENKVDKDNTKIKIVYIGTLGHSYDIKSVIDAIEILNNQGINNIKFIVIGDGPLKQEFECYAKKKNVDCEFTGRLEYEKMVGQLCSCDIAVNPIKKGSAGSIINKVGDYAMAGLPVINTQECKEYQKLVEKCNIGFNCESKNIAENIKKLIVNSNLREEKGKNNRELAEKKFNREESYNKIIKLIKGEKSDNS